MKRAQALINDDRSLLIEINLFVDIYGPDQDKFDSTGEQRKASAQRPILAASLREKEAPQKERTKLQKALRCELKRLTLRRKNLEVTPDKNRGTMENKDKSGDSILPERSNLMSEAEWIRYEDERVQQQVKALEDETKGTDTLLEKLRADLLETNLFLDVYGPQQDKYDSKGEQRKASAERPILAASIRTHEATQRKRKTQLKALQSELISLASRRKRHGSTAQPLR